MRYFIGILLSLIGRIIFSFRYKIKIKGKANLKKKLLNEKSGILFLPNHPAHVDPIFICMHLWPKFKVHPLVVEYVYRKKGINMIMRFVKALSIPNMDTSLNEIKIKNAQGVIETIIKGLNDRENYILYPSGRLKHTGKEIIGGASATHAILQGAKDANVVLIRTTGLWGSSFSRAYTGRSPEIMGTILRGIKNVLKSLVLFMPKRRVLIEIELPKADFPKHGTRIELNRYLENWYNNYPIDGKRVNEEPLTQISYSRWKKVFNDMTHKEKETENISDKKYSSKIEETVFAELARLQPDIEIKENMHLSADLGLDSLDVAELITFLNIHFDVGEIHPEDIETVVDVLAIAEGKKGKERKHVSTSTYTWPEESDRLPPSAPKGKTIIESFLITCDNHKNMPACSDDMVGVLSYKKDEDSSLNFC